MASISIDQSLANKLKTARRQGGYRTAKAFAKTHHIPYVTYAQHESGKRRLSARAILEYSKLLKIKPSWFLNGNDHAEITSSSANPTPLEISNRFINLEVLVNIAAQIQNIQGIREESIEPLKLVESAAQIYNYLSSEGKLEFTKDQTSENVKKTISHKNKTQNAHNKTIKQIK